jgi:hypothetical protein
MMSNEKNSKMRKSLQQVAFAAGLTATVIPAILSGIEYGKNSVQIKDIQSQQANKPYEVVLKKYHQEQTKQGLVNGFGFGLMTGVLYSSIVLSLTDKNRKVNSFEEICADDYLANQGIVRTNYSCNEK